MRWWRYLLYLLYRLLGLEAVRLNLRVLPPEVDRLYLYSLWISKERIIMAKIGDTFTATIAPTNAAGKPAPVFGAQYDPDFGGMDGYDITVAPDGLSAVLVAKAAGTGFELHVIATTKSGNQLTASVALPDVEAPVDEEAVALNLTVA